MRKLFGFAFVRITNKDQIVVKDDTHGLCVFKVCSGFYQNHFAMFIENQNWCAGILACSKDKG